MVRIGFGSGRLGTADPGAVNASVCTSTQPVGEPRLHLSASIADGGGRLEGSGGALAAGPQCLGARCGTSWPGTFQLSLHYYAGQTAALDEPEPPPTPLPDALGPENPPAHPLRGCVAHACGFSPGSPFHSSHHPSPSRGVLFCPLPVPGLFCLTLPHPPRSHASKHTHTSNPRCPAVSFSSSCDDCFRLAPLRQSIHLGRLHRRLRISYGATPDLLCSALLCNPKHCIRKRRAKLSQRHHASLRSPRPRLRIASSGDPVPDR